MISKICIRSKVFLIEETIGLNSKGTLNMDNEFLIAKVEETFKSKNFLYKISKILVVLGAIGIRGVFK